MTTDRRISVLWLIKGLGPGGAERLLVSHALVGDHERFDYRAAHLLTWKNHLVPELEAAGVDVTCLDQVRQGGLGWVPRLRKLLRDHPVDVLHVHSPAVAVPARMILATLPRAARPVLVYTEHNTWTSYPFVTRAANLLTYPINAASFAVSEEVRRTVPGFFRKRVETVVHGIPMEAVLAQRSERDSVREEFGVADDEVVIGTVANYRVQKAYPDLMTAARRVLDTGANVRFLAVGQGPLESELRAEQERLGLGDRFLLTGYRPDAIRILSGCDVFALASHHEGYPVAVMEALAMGLPVVATKVGGVPDAVRDGIEGILVEPQDVDGMVAALCKVAGDATLRNAMSRAASERGLLYDIKTAVDRIEASYADLARPAG